MAGCTTEGAQAYYCASILFKTPFTHGLLNLNFLSYMHQATDELIFVPSGIEGRPINLRLKVIDG